MISHSRFASITASAMIAKFACGKLGHASHDGRKRCGKVEASRGRGFASSAYNIGMEISLTPEVEAGLARIATEAGKPADQVVKELVASYVDHDTWFKQELQKGLDSLDRGKFVSHEEVGRRIERILKP